MKDYRLLLVASSVLALAACASKSPAPVSGGGVPVSPAASQPAREPLYTVKKGDTLYSIALDHGLDHRELAAMNNIENPNRILVGQQLRVKPAAAPQGEVVARPISTAGGIEQRSLDSVPLASQNTEALKRGPVAGKEPYSEQALARAQRGEAAPESVIAKPDPKPEPKPQPESDPKPDVAPAASGDEVPWIWPSTGKLIAPFTEGGSKGLDLAGKAGDPVIAAGDGKVVYAGTGLRGYGKLVIIKHNATYLSAYAHNQALLVKEGQNVTRGQRIAEMGSSDADQVKLHFEIRRQGKPVDPAKYLPAR